MQAHRDEFPIIPEQSRFNRRPRILMQLINEMLPMKMNGLMWKTKLVSLNRHHNGPIGYTIPFSFK